MPHPPMDIPCGRERLLDWFGSVDIYLFDQLLRGRITPEMRILDAGCGAGRNLRYLLRCGADVHGVDRDPTAIAQLRRLAADLAPGLDAARRFPLADLRRLPWADASFDAVLASAVLHFADDEEAFEAMLLEMWRVLRSGGVLFARLASTIGIADRVEPRGGRRFGLPDGTERFLVDEPYLLGLGELLGAEMLDPIKTTNVQNRRAMTTWVLRRRDDRLPFAADAAERRRAAAGLTPVLRRVRSVLYGPGGRRDPPGADPVGGARPDGAEELGDALLRGARVYDDPVRQSARDLADALRALEGPGEEGPPGSTRLDRAKAALSGLETQVLIGDALRADGVG